MSQEIPEPRETIPELAHAPSGWHGDPRRTTVKLPAALDSRVRQEAARRGMTLSEWTREAIEAYLPGGSGPVRRLGAAAAGRSGQRDVSDRIEEILAAELGGVCDRR